MEIDPGVLELAWIQSKLKRSPRWPAGHLRGAALALQRGDLVFAANSLSAAAHLGYNDQSDRQAALLHGKLYIAAGEFARAVEVLKPSVVGAKDPVQVREELIAAFVGLERYGEALAVLHRIPEAERGPELSTLKVFLERKLSGSPLSEQSSSR